MDDGTHQIKDLEKIFCDHLGIDAGFVKSILAESDWGFVIKVHALSEAALTHLLMARFVDSELRGILSKLPTCDERGKLGFLKELKLISKDHRKFIVALSQMRNIYAHEIRNINKPLKDYCEEKPRRAEELYASIAPMLSNPIGLNGESVARDRFIRENLRLAIWVGALAVVSALINEAASCVARGKAAHGTS